MLTDSFKYFWRRTVPGGIWWENREDAGVQFLWLMFFPMVAIGLLIGRIENIGLLKPVFEFCSHTSWYISLPVYIVAYTAASVICNAALFLALKALGYALLVRRYRKFAELAEREWLLAITDQTKPTTLNKEEWLLDRIERMAKTRYDVRMKCRCNCV